MADARSAAGTHAARAIASTRLNAARRHSASCTRHLLRLNPDSVALLRHVMCRQVPLFRALIRVLAILLEIAPPARPWRTGLLGCLRRSDRALRAILRQRTRSHLRGRVFHPCLQVHQTPQTFSARNYGALQVAFEEAMFRRYFLEEWPPARLWRNRSSPASTALRSSASRSSFDSGTRAIFAAVSFTMSGSYQRPHSFPRGMTTP